MHFVEEIVVDEFLPTFRSMLAEALRERGLTQSEVADRLGISQSAVSKYVHGDVERNRELLESKPLRDHVERLADQLASGDVTPTHALVETEVLIRELERGGVLGQLHERAEPGLAEYDGEFDVHDPEGEVRSAERALSSVRQGLRVLENTGGITTLIPAVGSNLVQALPDADGIDDVAGIPGRIVDVKGRATIPSDPEFGASEHVARVLLAARAAGSDHRATLNVRYDPDLIDDLEGAGHTAVEFDSEADLDEAVADALDREPDADVLFQSGGFGIEPIVYVLGPDAATVVERVRGLV